MLKELLLGQDCSTCHHTAPAPLTSLCKHRAVHGQVQVHFLYRYWVQIGTECICPELDGSKSRMLPATCSWRIVLGVLFFVIGFIQFMENPCRGLSRPLCLTHILIPMNSIMGHVWASVFGADPRTTSDKFWAGDHLVVKTRMSGWEPII